jgi:hypothetical protein
MAGHQAARAVDDGHRFDRAAFHKEFNADVVAFFLKHLGGAPQQ